MVHITFHVAVLDRVGRVLTSEFVLPNEPSNAAFDTMIHVMSSARHPAAFQIIVTREVRSQDEPPESAQVGRFLRGELGWDWITVGSE
jgi:hypothetical protein